MALEGVLGSIHNCSCCQHIPPLNYLPSFSSHPFHCCQCCPSCPYCQQNRLAFGFCVPTCFSCPRPPSSSNTGGIGVGRGQFLGNAGGTGSGGGQSSSNTEGTGTGGNQSSGNIAGGTGTGGGQSSSNARGIRTGGGKFSGNSGGTGTGGGNGGIPDVHKPSGGQSSGVGSNGGKKSPPRRTGSSILEERNINTQPNLEIRNPIGTNPSWSHPKLYASGVQTLIPIFVTAAAVPSLIFRAVGGGNVEKALIQASLFAMGISTLLQVWFGTRLPVLMKSSRNFTIPVLAISLSSASRFNTRGRYSKIDNTNDFNTQIFRESIKRLQGATIIGAIFQIIIGFSCLGEIFARYLSPLSTVPLLTLTGIGLFTSAFSVLANCNVELGLPALVLMVFSTQYLPQIWKSKKEFLEQYSVSFSALILWAYAEILKQTSVYDNAASYRSQGIQSSCADNSGVVDAPWFKIPLPFPYGGPSFEVGDAFLIMAACFVDAIESAGTYIATSRLAGANPIPPFALSRGIGLQGIGNLVDALLGTGGGSTASVEQAGLVGLTQIGSRRVIQVSATLLLLCSVIGKLGALLASIPLPIELALQMVLLPYIASTGLDYLQFCNMNSFRLIFIIGFSIFIGLSVPQYFYEYVVISGQGPVRTSSTWLNDTVRVIFSSAPTVGVIVAFVLDRTHRPKDRSTQRDSGLDWKDTWDEIGNIDTTYSIISNIDDLCS